MKTFMLLCFLLLGLAFYQLSGGADFEPQQRQVAVAIEEELDTVAAATELAVVEQEVSTPSEGTIQDRLSRALVTPEVIAVTLDTTPPEIQVADPDLSDGTDDVALADQTDPEAAEIEIAEAPVVEPTATDLRQVSSSRVNMRNGPGTTFDVLVTLNGGTAAEVIDSNGDGWVRVRVRDTGQEGWMAEYLLEPING